MESRKYTFNKSTLTVKFDTILDTQAEVIVSSDDCYVTMGAENGGYPPTQNGDIRSLFWLFSLMALQN